MNPVIAGSRRVSVKFAAFGGEIRLHAVCDPGLVVRHLYPRRPTRAAASDQRPFLGVVHTVGGLLGLVDGMHQRHLRPQQFQVAALPSLEVALQRLQEIVGGLQCSLGGG